MMGHFDGQQITIACLAALFAQLSFVALFSTPPPEEVRMDISDDNVRPIAVAITPVPILKLGSPNAGQLPSQWQRQKPVAQKSDSPLPSPQAKQTPDAIPTAPVADAAVAPVENDAGPSKQDLNPQDASTGPASAQSDAASAVASAAGSGSPEGSKDGTETDPLKARAIAEYRANLTAWFLGHFSYCRSQPIQMVQGLKATAVVQIDRDQRKVTSFAITKPAGDPGFDGAVSLTLRHIQSSEILPAPPPLYPDLMPRSLPLSFQCH
jgi:hypothetical protein